MNRFDEEWLIDIRKLVLANDEKALDHNLTAAIQKYKLSSDSLINRRARLDDIDCTKDDIDEFSADLSSARRLNAVDLVGVLTHGGSIRIEDLPALHKEAVANHALLGLACQMYKGALEDAENILVKVQVQGTFIPDGIPRSLLEWEVKQRNEIWQIHKDDKDEHPCRPHAHCYAEGLKLDLRNGNLWRKRKLEGAMSKKNFENLRTLFAEKGAPLQDIDYSKRGVES